MNCKCYEIFQEKLRDHTGDPEAKIELGFALIGNKFVGLPVIPAIFRSKKSNGELKLKPEKQTVFGNYCPFCGKEVKTQKENNGTI